jgi:hypothetical protein
LFSFERKEAIRRIGPHRWSVKIVSFSAFGLPLSGAMRVPMALLKVRESDALAHLS